MFNNLVINIACTTAASCFQETGSGIPVVVSYTPNFDASAFIKGNFTPGLTDVQDGSACSVCRRPPSSAFAIGSLYASGGSVTLNADSIGGGGKITANGSPIISVNNPTNASLILSGGAFIPSAAFGQVVYTGGARSVPASLTVNSNPAGTPTISINNSFVAPECGSGPELFITGDITNVNGLVTINNTTGSYGLAANLTAQQLNITVPNGVVAISATGPGGIYFGGRLAVLRVAKLHDVPGWQSPHHGQSERQHRGRLSRQLRRRLYGVVGMHAAQQREPDALCRHLAEQQRQNRRQLLRRLHCGGAIRTGRQLQQRRIPELARCRQHVAKATATIQRLGSRIRLFCPSP